MPENTETHQTTFTEPSDHEVAAERAFDASRELIWEMHTSPEHLPHWLLGPEGWTMTVCEIDLRPGGAWHYVWQGPGGEPLEMRGEYREVTPPERLINTESWGGEWPETVNTLTLTEHDGETVVRSNVFYPSKEARDAAIATGMKDGWAESYDRLDRYLLTLG